MKSVLFLFIKAFTFFSIPFGALMIIFDLIEGAPNLNTAIFKGVIYGFMMAITLVGAHVLGIRSKKLGPINKETIKVAHRKVIISPLSKNEVIDRLIDDPTWNQFDIQTQDNKIEIKTKASIWSWGEKVKILVQQVADGLNQYEISSVPDMGSTMVDYGRNLHNVQRLEKLITS